MPGDLLKGRRKETIAVRLPQGGELEIKSTLSRSDEPRAIAFAAAGMQFDLYTKSRLAKKLYGWFFWFSELNRATRVLAAYRRGRLAGVLLAGMKGEKTLYYSRLRAAYIAAFLLSQCFIFRGGTDVYGRANDRMLENYCKKGEPDGEILFLAVDPKLENQGIGTALLQALKAVEPGKNVYLFTDTGCNFRFYEHRGFTREGQRDIEFHFGGRRIPLTCFLYAKVL